MRRFPSRAVNAIKTVASGLSLTLIVCCGVGIMRTLMEHYGEFVPGGLAKVPSLTRWFASLPQHNPPSGLAFALLFAGGSMMAAQDKERSLVVIHRMALAFVTVGIFASALPYRNFHGVLASEAAADWTEYVWLVPCCLPLVLALIRHRHARAADRKRTPSHPS